MLLNKSVYAIFGITLLLLVSCEQEPLSSSPEVGEQNYKQRIRVVSSQLPLKTETEAQKVTNVNVAVIQNTEKEIYDTVMKVEEDVDNKISKFEEWRNPFQPFITKAAEGVEEESKPKTPLEKYDINELKLIAIIWGIKRPTAMIEDPDGTGYIVKRGMLVGDNKGRVVKILKDKVIVEEKYRDLLGNAQVEEIALELHNHLEEGRSL